MLLSMQTSYIDTTVNDHLEELIVTGGGHVLLDGRELHEELPGADEVGVHGVWHHLFTLHGLLLRVVQEHDAHHTCRQNKLRKPHKRH